MISKANILASMQFAAILSKDPINETSDPRLTITYQYAGTTEPVDIPGSGAGFTGYTAFTAAEKSAFRDMLDHIETFLNVRFVRARRTRRAR